MSPVVQLIFKIACSLQQATLIFAGDAMMHQGQIDAARQPDGTYAYTGCFDAIAPPVRAADLAVVNLETPVSPPPYAGYPCFNAPAAYLDALAHAGFDLFLTANNHTLDRRDRGLRATLDSLDARGLAHIGTYRNAAHRRQAIPCIHTVNGFRIGFLNYTYGTNGITLRSDAIVDYIDPQKIRADIAATRAAGAEIICAAMHWGNEYQLLPNANQRHLADSLRSWGADLIIGAHPHVIQPMEMRADTTGRKTLVVYSLGNLISNMRTRDTRGGALATVTLRRDTLGRARVDTAAYTLTFTLPPGAGRRSYTLVHPDSCPDPRWRPHAKAFAATARDIFRRHNRSVPEKN